MDYASNTYLALTLSSTSPYYTNPSSLSSLDPHGHLSYVGQVGALHDVHLVALPKSTSVSSSAGVESESERQEKERILQVLRAGEGVLRVDVQEPKLRAKRDEF